MIVLFEHYQKEEVNKFKLRAALFGVNIDGEQKKSEETGLPQFKDPKDYENMSVEERKKLTEKMMKAHKKWAGDKFNEESA